MNEMNREMRRMSEREERLAKKADRNVGQYSGEKVSRLKRIANYILEVRTCLLYTSPSPRARTRSRMPSSA